MEQDGAFEFTRHDEPWDEFAWEAFLQEQDGRTERYMELEEKFRGLPDASHWVQQDDPDAVNRILRDWLGRARG